MTATKAPEGQDGCGDDAAARPAASIIIVTRNRRAQLETALASVERQRLAEGSFEVIVVDDGSDDGTSEMLSKLEKRSLEPGRPRLTALRNQKSLGPGPARNRWRAGPACPPHACRPGTAPG